MPNNTECVFIHIKKKGGNALWHPLMLKQIQHYTNNASCMDSYSFVDCSDRVSYWWEVTNIIKKSCINLKGATKSNVLPVLFQEFRLTYMTFFITVQDWDYPEVTQVLTFAALVLALVLQKFPI